MHRLAIVLVAALGASSAAAQSVAQRVGASDGIVQVIFPSRVSACGDGESFIGNVLGESNRGAYYSDNSSFRNDDESSTRRCAHGPARVVATVVDHEVTRIHVYVGPVHAQRDGRTLDVSAADAASWLTALVTQSPPRLADDAMLPLVLADSGEPWPTLLRVARDDQRPGDVRRAAITWLGTAVTDRLGLSAVRAETDDDELRTEAVFVLSQRPKSESLPELVDLARGSKNPSVRRAAIFWLGQTGDARATELYANLLGLQ